MKLKEAVSGLNDYFAAHNAAHCHAAKWSVIRKELEEISKTPDNPERLKLFACCDCRAAEECIIAIERNSDLCYDLRKKHRAIS